MNRLLKNLSLKVASAANVHPTRMTPKDEVEALIDMLAPVSGGQDLIRFGPNGDGGYLIPDDLDGITACFSPGVNQVSGFEKDCAELGMQVFMADKSVKKPAEAHELFAFTQKHLGFSTNQNFMTLDDWVDDSVHEASQDLILQMDIDGSEYEVLLSASNRLMQRFRIIVVEFHWLAELWNSPFFELASSVFRKILQTHSCVHNHPNNIGGSVKIRGIEIPLFSEMTFLRNDRLYERTAVTTFPHPLDSDNSDSASLPLPTNWYRH